MTKRISSKSHRRTGLASVSLALGVLMSLVPAGNISRAAGEKSVASVRREAEATWLVRDPSSRYDRLDVSIRVWRDDTADGGVTRVRVTRYGCEVWPDHVSCRPLDKLVKTIPNQRFEFDDTLKSAEVRFQARGFLHRVKWTGTSTPGRSEIDRYCGPTPVPSGRGVGRDAEGAGSLFGQRLKPSDAGRWGDAYLSSMVFVDLC
jgi:hypothetical protein